MCSVLLTPVAQVLLVYHTHTHLMHKGRGTAKTYRLAQYVPDSNYLDIVHAQLDFKLMPQQLQQTSYASQVSNLQPRPQVTGWYYAVVCDNL